MLKIILGLVIFSTLLAGCTVKPTSKPTVKIICPQIVEYNKDEQLKAASELEKNSVPVVESMITDYGILRAEIRECSK